ncbi:MAG: alpha/beta fold hydrolase [Kiritimatiellia bacterium]
MAPAQRLRPAGVTVDLDARSNAVYLVEANGIDIGYKLIGTGQPLLLIMGLGGTMDDWPWEVVEALAGKYQLIIPDNRGMGHSTTNAEPFTCRLCAADMVGLMDALALERTHVLGYSIGSVIVQQMLLEHPERISRAVVHATTINGARVAEGLQRINTDNPTIRRQLAAMADWRTPMDQVPGITNQVLLVVGTADEVVGLENSQQLALALPGAWLIPFKGGTHFLMRESPAAFAGVVEAFLENDTSVQP